MVPPPTWTLFSSVFQLLCAAVCVALKSKPEFSACQFALAFAVLTNEMPTLACTTWLELVLNVRNTEFGPALWPSLTIWLAVNGWSKTMSKCTV